jgi:polyisoprenoid-binding protein YceI
MKKIFFLGSVLAIVFTLFAFSPPSGKLVSTRVHIEFFSTTPAENIQANNNTTVSTLNTETGKFVFSVPMQGFEFKKSLMQKHFNSGKFLDTKKFRKAKLKGEITNFSQINFEEDGVYQAEIEGEMAIKGVTQSFKDKGTVTVKSGKIEVNSEFNITLADYGITFVKGKPSSNIAKTVEVSVQAEYQQ